MLLFKYPIALFLTIVIIAILYSLMPGPDWHKWIVGGLVAVVVDILVRLWEKWIEW